jgi:hypothetical protein
MVRVAQAHSHRADTMRLRQGGAMTPKSEMTPDDARRDHAEMLRFLAVNAVIGMLIGLAAAALIMVLDLGGIGTRIAHAGNPILPVVLIALPMALVFGGAVAASAIWLLPYERKYARERQTTDDNDGDE